MLMLLLLVGCSTPAPQKAEIIYPTENEYQNSELNISYMLGHNQYTFSAESKNSEILISSQNNAQVIESKKIDKDQYINFAKKVSDFAKNFLSKNPHHKKADCKTPFSIEIRVNDKKSFIQGCRQQDKEGELGKLIRDGEILFFQ